MLKLRVSKKDTTKSRVFPTNGWRRPIPSSKNGNSLITPSTNSIPGLPQIVEQNKNKTSLWKRWNPHWENSKTSSRKRRGLSITYKKTSMHSLLSLSSITSPLPVTFYNKKKSRNCDSRDLKDFKN